MKIISSIGKASGQSSSECHFVAYRYDSRYGLQDDTSESWLIQVDGRLMYGVYRTGGPFLGLWRSAAGCAYVVSVHGISVNLDPRPRGSHFKLYSLPCSLRGVWGVDDSFVLTWGAGRDGETIFRWDGKDWHPMKSPGYIEAIHGISRDLFYAVGADGMIARWDGSAWVRLVAPMPGAVTDVFVASADRMYAVGHENHLFEGSIYGWSVRTTHSQPIQRVACFGEKVYVSSHRDGLLCLDGTSLTSVSPAHKANSFDVRGKMLLGCPDRISESTDGKTFEDLPVEKPEDMMSQEKPRWL